MERNKKVIHYFNLFLLLDCEILYVFLLPLITYV